MDLWLHAGDFSQDAAFLAELTGLPTRAAAGNCDGATTAKPDEFVEAEGVRIWLTHGHRYRAKERGDELTEWAIRYEADVVVFGHSHVPEISRRGGVLLVNPGSAALPRGGRGPSCGVIQIKDGVIDAELVSLI